MGPTFNVVFLSPNNPLRAHLAAALLNQAGRGRFQAFGLGDGADEGVDAQLIHLLESKAIPLAGAGAVRRADFASEQAPPVDFVCRLFDPLAGELAPTWPGEQLSAEWHIADPLRDRAVSAIELQRRVAATFHQLDRRIALLVNLPLEKLDALLMQKHIGDIHERSQGDH